MMSIFGKNLRALRERKNYSQRELASKLHIANATISLYENAGQCPQRKEIIEGLKKVLECSEVDLFGYSDGYFNSQITGLKNNVNNNLNVNISNIRDKINQNLNKPLNEELFYDIIYPTSELKNTTFKEVMVDESMDKVIPIGSTIYFKKCNNLETSTKHIICIMLNNVMYIRRLLKIENSDLYILSPESSNTKFQMIQFDKNTSYKLLGIAKSFNYTGELL